MNKLLQVDFEFNGPFGDEMTQLLQGLAESINQEPGLIWKIWTESAADKLGGGIYLFEDAQTAEAYLVMHTARLKEMGVEEVRGQIFDINLPLSKVNQAPLV